MTSTSQPSSDGRVKRKRRSPWPKCKPSPEHAQAIREAQLRHWADPEYRARMVEKRRAAGLRRRGITYRLGIPYGMRRAEADNMWIDCRLQAKETILDLKMAGQLDDIDPRGEEALETALTILRSKSMNRDRLAAAKLVLDFTRSKPVAKQHVTVDAAEAWLSALTSETDDHEEG